MVLPLFGWGPGDMVSAGKALYKIGQAFSETKGAETQYLEAAKVLDYLARDRRRAQNFVDTNNSSYATDVRSKLAVVDTAYEAFEKHQDDYKELAATLTAMTTSKKRDHLKKQGKKVKWAIDQMNGKLQNLKDAVAEPLGSINTSILHVVLWVYLRTTLLDAYEPIRENLAAIQKAGSKDQVDLLRFEMTLMHAPKIHHTELVAVQNSLDGLLAHLASRETEVGTRLDELEAILQRIGEQTTALEITQKSSPTKSNRTLDEIEAMNKLQDKISKDTAGLMEKLLERQDTVSELPSTISDEFSRVKTMLGRLQVGQLRSDITTFAAGSMFALMAISVYFLPKAPSIDSPRQRTGSTSNNYSARPVDATEAATSKVDNFVTPRPMYPDVESWGLQRKSEPDEDTQCMNSTQLPWAKGTMDLMESIWAKATAAQTREQSARTVQSRHETPPAGIEANAPENQGDSCTMAAPSAQQPPAPNFMKWQCHRCKQGPILYAIQRTCDTCNHSPCDTCKKDTNIPTPLGARALSLKAGMAAEPHLSRLPFCLSFERIQPAAALPPHTPFYIVWKPLIPSPQHTERPKYYRQRLLCSPPVIKEAFRPQKSHPLIYKWTPGSLDPASPQDLLYLEVYKTSSVFWRPDHQTYLTVPYDCTQASVIDRARVDPLDHWERLKFNHEAIEGRCVSVVGHGNENDVLAAEGPFNWLGELIPPAHQRHGEPAVPNTKGTSYLAGDISIIMALAVLSTAPDLVRWTIEHSFRPPNQSTTWVPHGQMNRAVEAEHGTVVHILVDNRFPGVRTHLDAWNLGQERAVLS